MNCGGPFSEVRSLPLTYYRKLDLVSAFCLCLAAGPPRIGFRQLSRPPPVGVSTYDPSPNLTRARSRKHQATGGRSIPRLNCARSRSIFIFTQMKRSAKQKNKEKRKMNDANPTPRIPGGLRQPSGTPLRSIQNG